MSNAKHAESTGWYKKHTALRQVTFKKVDVIHVAWFFIRFTLGLPST